MKPLIPKEEYRTEIHPCFQLFALVCDGNEDVLAKKISEWGRSISDCHCEWKSETFHVKGEARKVISFLMKSGLMYFKINRLEKENRFQIDAITYPWINIIDLDKTKAFAMEEFK